MSTGEGVPQNKDIDVDSQESFDWLVQRAKERNQVEVEQIERDAKKLGDSLDTTEQLLGSNDEAARAQGIESCKILGDMLDPVFGHEVFVADNKAQALTDMKGAIRDITEMLESADLGERQRGLEAFRKMRVIIKESFDAFISRARLRLLPQEASGLDQIRIIIEDCIRLIEERNRARAQFGGITPDQEREAA